MNKTNLLKLVGEMDNPYLVDVICKNVVLN